LALLCVSVSALVPVLILMPINTHTCQRHRHKLSAVHSIVVRAPLPVQLPLGTR